MADLLQSIARNKIAGVYYLVGERHPQEQVLAALRQAVLGAEESDFNLESLAARDAGPAGILAAARTVPMLGGRRLVLVREVHLLSNEEQGRLLPYIRDPSPTTCLVLMADKADTRFKLFIELKKLGVLHRFEPLKERQVASWVSTEAQRQGIPLAPGAAERVAEAIGTDMGRLATALEQLSLYVGPDRAVTPEDVEDLLAETRERSIFELTNAVGRGNRQEALQVLRRMLEAREPGLRILTMLARLVRQLWSIRELEAGGSDNKTIADQVGCHPYFLREMRQQASRIGERVLSRMHTALFEADRALKSSPLPDWMILERLVISLCPPRQA